MNPYQFGMVPQFQPAQMQPQRQAEMINGINGAQAYQIGPNSSAWILDKSGKISWMITTDAAGYKTIQAYDVVPHQDAPEPDYGTLENRIKKLEEIVNGYTGNSDADGKKPSYAGTNQTDDGHGPNGR
jgi:hypothetical protein